MTKLFLASLVLLLAGCASQGGYQGMSAEQITALATMKDMNANCVKGQTPITGSFVTVFVNVDAAVIDNGSVTVTADCAVTFSNQQTPKPGTTTTTTVVTPR
jgi:hypothetical protein